MFSKMKQLEEEIVLKKERNSLIKNHKLDLEAIWARGGRAGTLGAVWARGGRALWGLIGPGAGGGYSRPVEQHEQEGADDERLQHLPVAAQGGQPGHEELPRRGHEARHHRDHESLPRGAQLYSWNTEGTREP